MNISFARIIPVFILFMLLFGCGGSEPPKKDVEADKAQKIIADLREQLKQADEELGRSSQENKELLAKAESLAKQLQRTPQQPVGRGAREPGEEGLSAEQRVGLLGAKALAEFQAGQLKQRLDTLSKDLNAKEAELQAIGQTAQRKDNEMAALRQNLEQLQTSEQRRNAGLSSRLDNLSKEMEKQSAEADRLKKDLAERSELLATLKGAVSDSAKLKSQAEAEGARLRADLTEALKQLQAAKTTGSQQLQEIERLETREAESQEELAECRHAAQQLQAATDRLQKETRDLRTKIDQLSAQVRAEEAEEEAPSVIDRILR